MSPRPTIYESQARRRRRRRRGAVLGALIAVAVVAAVAGGALVLLRGAEPGAGASAVSPAEAPSPTAAPPRVVGLTDVKVRRGEKATIRYRIVAGAGTTTAVTLVVTDAAGAQVKARRLTGDASDGLKLQAAVPIDLPPGRYTYTLRLGDGEPAASVDRGATRPCMACAMTALDERAVLLPVARLAER